MAMTPPAPLWWLSYADANASRGIVIARGASFLDAVRRARELGVSPGGQVRGWVIPSSELARLECFEGRRLTEPEARALGGMTEAESHARREPGSTPDARRTS